MTTNNRYRIAIKGMSCGGCVESVKKVLAKVPGLVVESVKIGEAVVDVSKPQEDLGRIAVGLQKAGYELVVSKMGVGEGVSHG